MDAKLIFQTALKYSATLLVLMHNHTSENLQASDADLQLIKKVVEADRLLDLPIFDLIIFTSESYYSFAEEGHL